MYKLTDLIDKIIKIEELGAELYIKKSEGLEGQDNIKILAKALANQERKHVKIYEDFRENILNCEDIDVEFDIYDKASKLVYEFMHLSVSKEIHEVKDLLDLAIGFEKDHLALVKRIRGLFVSAPNDMETNNYKLLTVIISQEEEHVRDLESVLKKINTNM